MLAGETPTLSLEKYVINIISGISIIFSLVGCSPNIPNDHVVVQLSWLANGQFSFICSALVEGYYEKEGLDVEIREGGPAISFLRSSTILAQNEEVDIAVESVLTELVEGRALPLEVDQLRVKIIAAFWQDNPLGFLVRADSGIDSLSELVRPKEDGTKYVIGATPDAVLIKAIAKSQGVSYEDLEIITTSYDTTPFLIGEVDALWSFWTTQAYAAEAANIPYKFLSLSEIPGLTQPSNIIITKETILDNRPDMLKKWLRASIKGAEFTVKHSQQAAKNILDPRCGGKNLSFDQELWLIEKSKELYYPSSNTDCIGFINPETIITWANTYLSITGNPNAPTEAQLVDLTILNDIYLPSAIEKCQ